MLDIKKYNDKIKIFNNTKKMTHTMKMIAGSKLHRAHLAQSNAKLFAHKITGLIARLSASVKVNAHPLLIPRLEVKRILVLVFTSDKGLCGAFNHNINRRVVAWVNEEESIYEKIDVSFCGKRGYSFLRKSDRINIKNYYENVTDKPTYDNAVIISDDLIQDFLGGKYDEVYLTYNMFYSPFSQETTFQKILPIESEELLKEHETTAAEYIFEPEASKLLAFLVPEYLHFKIYFSLLENAAGEHGARMTAMDTATKNATELMDRYTLFRNRARQDAITAELAEIVSGREALK